MKRVYTLYRVSTKQQMAMDKNDIPMQRIACHEFASKQVGWMITKEFVESGVSGYKVSASKRDAIQDLRDAALNREFDILLVFMFDRLGRIEYETPFILQWFVEHGIETWSVNEGQQRFENHVDKLTNFIRFWQASGESEKTSIRVKTRMKQMTSEGLYTGGVVPYGYRLVAKGRKNKKGQEMRDLVINEAEAEIVKMVFKMTIEQGYGSHRMAEYLNRLGYLTHNNAPFQSSYILRLLKNPIYRGFLERGGVTSERVESLQIISDIDFFKVQNILRQRANKSDEKRRIAMTNKGRALLSGNVFCAHCGCRLSTSRYYESYTRSDGSLYEKEYGRYICYHRSRRLNDCDGATTYIAEKIDERIILLIHQMFQQILCCKSAERIEQAYKEAMAKRRKNEKRLKKEHEKLQEQLEKLYLEIGKSLTGESLYNPQDLNLTISRLKTQLQMIEESLMDLQSDIDVKEQFTRLYDQLSSWAKEFDAMPFQAKKMVANQLFSRVEIGKGYRIRCNFDESVKLFCSSIPGDWNHFDDVVVIV